MRQSDVVSALRQHGNRWAARWVSKLPATDGVLDPDHVDGLLVRCHAELQRLEEEFAQGRRLASVLRPLLEALRTAGVEGPLRVVDVGCGTGFVLRWLAAHGELGDDVELVGCDYNAALLSVAQRTAEAEELRCRFVLGNAFTLEEPATVYTSTGVIHHFRGEDLVAFFRGQRSAKAFLHHDIQPSWLAPLGAWLFHVARMREPLARHDGTLSARRAYTGAELCAAAARALPELAVGMYDNERSLLPLMKVLRPVVGCVPEAVEAFRAGLGSGASSLELVA